MNISQTTMNFTGKLMNQTYIGRDPQTKKPVLKEYSSENCHIMGFNIHNVL